jgi:hypothetical protein
MISEWRTRLQAVLDGALLTAVCEERQWRVRGLLMLGADPNATGWRVLGLVSALTAAYLLQNALLFNLLIQAGTDPDGSALESSPLHERIAEASGEECDDSWIAKG